MSWKIAVKKEANKLGRLFNKNIEAPVMSYESTFDLKPANGVTTGFIQGFSSYYLVLDFTMTYYCMTSDL